jgi:hypothetical protein
MSDAKKKGIPAPGVYDLPKKKKFTLGFQQKSDKNSSMTDNAIWYAKQTPTVCYKDLGSLTTLTKPKIFAAKIYKENEKEPSAGSKI